MTDSRIAVFIDGASIYITSKALGFDVDYRRFKHYLSGRGQIVRTHYYTTINEESEYNSLRPLLDWLDYNGYHVTAKPIREATDNNGRRRPGGSIVVDLTVDAMTLAPRIDEIYLISGDNDFTPLVHALQRMGVRVTVFSTLHARTPMIADELRRQTDTFVDLTAIRERIERQSEQSANTNSDASRVYKDSQLETRYGIRSDLEEVDD